MYGMYWTSTDVDTKIDLNVYWATACAAGYRNYVAASASVRRYPQSPSPGTVYMRG